MTTSVSEPAAASRGLSTAVGSEPRAVAPCARAGLRAVAHVTINRRHESPSDGPGRAPGLARAVGGSLRHAAGPCSLSTGRGQPQAESPPTVTVR